MIADIIITTCGRPDMFERSLRSLSDAMNSMNYRLTVVIDGKMWKESLAVIERIEMDYSDDLCIDYVLINKFNCGLGPSLNQALAHIDMVRKYDDSPPPLTVYLQDDILYSSLWLEKLSKMFFAVEQQYNIGFASGIECIEHPIKKIVSEGVILKDWIRATCMMARHEYWMSMLPIPPIDPETGMRRGKPNDGLGSGVDWHFIRVHPNSVCKTGKTCLVIPGLLTHMGYKDSTWLKRDLPESDEDKKKIAAER